MEDAVKWEQVAIEWGFQSLAHFCAEKFAEMEREWDERTRKYRHS